jgi:hypothetical protein
MIPRQRRLNIIIASLVVSSFLILGNIWLGVSVYLQAFLINPEQNIWLRLSLKAVMLPRLDFFLELLEDFNIVFTGR